MAKRDVVVGVPKSKLNKLGFKPHFPDGPPEPFVLPPVQPNLDATPWEEDPQGNWSRIVGFGVNRKGR